MTKGEINNFDNIGTTMRVPSVIQDRINLVAGHMYKQYLEYQQSTNNTKDVFFKMLENVKSVIDYLKQSFVSRGITGQNIYYEIEQMRALVVMNILWHSISIMAIANDKPQALPRENNPPLFSGRIIALNGRYSDILKKENDNEMQALLEHEVASLYVPADKSAPAIIKIHHLINKEICISQQEAPREFLMKVIEIICGGGLYHEESIKKTF